MGRKLSQPITTAYQISSDREDEWEGWSEQATVFIPCQHLDLELLGNW